MKRVRNLSSTVAVILLALVNESARAQGDAARGARVFGVCMSCHSIRAGEHLTGPSLASIWNRKAGTVPGFERYSEALKRADLVWTGASLEKWIAGPEKLVPGTSMTFAGLPDARNRDDLIAFLKLASEGKAPKAQAAPSGDMMMRRGKVNLKKVPPEGQVVSIDYCRDTYSIRTADGKVAKVWEFNLRFKTDSGSDGPMRGKPAIVGAGMQGDRASVVFSAPDEISTFIKSYCG
jgi:cytochrome c